MLGEVEEQENAKKVLSMKLDTKKQVEIHKPCLSFPLLYDHLTL